MASPTTLEGFLRDDEDNFTLRLSNAYGEHVNKGDRVIFTITYRPHGSATGERLDPEGGLVDQAPSMAGIDNIVDRVQRTIVDKLGTSPIGAVRICAYLPGQSAKPLVRMFRSLCPPDADGLVSPNAALVRSLFEQAQAERRMLQDLLVQSKAHDANTISQLANALANSATVRTATTGGSDIQGLSTIIGLFAVVVGMPAIKEAMGLEPDATMGQVLTRARTFLGVAQDTARRSLEDRPAPQTVAAMSNVGELLPQLAGGGPDIGQVEPDNGANGHDDEDGDNGDDDAAAILARLKGDPDLAVSVLRGAMKDPKARALATSLLGG